MKNTKQTDREGYECPVIFQEELIGQQPMLKAYALRLTGNIMDSEDLLQDTLYRAFKYQRRFRSGTNLPAWVRTIMRNIFLDSRRKFRYENPIQEGETDHAPNVKTSANEGYDGLLVNDVRREVERSGSLMSEIFKQFERGYNYKEISEMNRIPIGTVKSRVFRERGILRKRLAYV